MLHRTSSGTYPSVQGPYAPSMLQHGAQVGASSSYDPALGYESRQPGDYPGRSGASSAALDSKRSRSDEEESMAGGNGKVKKTRQTQSCDACRARKVKCDRTPPGPDGSSPSDTRTACTHCQQLGSPCTFDYKPKKRGPPNMYLKRMHGQAGETQPVGGMPNAPSMSVSATSVPSSYQPAPWGGSYGMPVAVAGAVAAGPSFVPPAHPVPRQVSTEWVATPLSSAGPSPEFLTTPTHSSAARDMPLPPSAPGSAAPSVHMSPAYSPSFVVYPTNPSANPLDRVVPRSLLMYVINLYWDYIYCLVPCLHRPSFMADVEAHREERPNEEEWVALVLGCVGSTLVQMPRSFVPLPRPEVRATVKRCMEAVSDFLGRDFFEITTTRLIITYLYTGGQMFMCDSLFGSNHALALRLRIHEERTYAPLDPIECELRRRIFWLMYGGDKTFASLEGFAMFWREVDIDVCLPTVVDDEYITRGGYLEQPPGSTPAIAGFYYITKLFRFLGQCIETQKRDRRKPPSGLLLQMRINEVDQLFEQVMSLMDGCPEPLKLDMSGTPATRMVSIQEDFDAVMTTDIRHLLLDAQGAKESRAMAKDSFLVQQANIYVTQQMVRYLVLQYRDELGALQDNELGAADKPTRPSISPTRASLSGSRRGRDRTLFTEAEKDQVASDLLVILSKIPIQIIAVNSYSLISKIRFVASTLLDALQTPSGIVDPSPDVSRMTERTARAQNYLWDFLRILSEIEALYSLEDEVKPAAS